MSRWTLRNVAALVASLVGLTLLASAAPAQQSAQRYDAALVVADEFHRFERVLDLDGDGYDDAIDWWWTNSSYERVTVTGWINDGSGRLAEAWNFEIDLGTSSAGEPRDSAAGNLDGDARDDFALSFRNRIYLYASNGAAPPTPLPQIVNGPLIDSMVLADFDDDGLDDVAYSDGYATIALNGGDGTFTPAEPAWNTVGALEDHLRVVDMDDDGLPDLMNPRGTLIDFYEIKEGKLVRQAAVAHDMGTNANQVPAAGDVDGDGDEDVVVFGPTGYAVLRKTGGIIVAEPSRPGGPATDLADVDGDGDLDGVCCGGSGDGYSRNVWASRFEIAHNDGTGAFAPAFPIENIGSHHIAGAADLDHDGDLDLVGGRTIFYANGPITTVVQADVEPFGSAGDIGTTPRHVADADGDGDPDLFVGVVEHASNWADGTFSLEATQVDPAAVGTSWQGPGIPGDFDGDGDTDLVVSRVSGVWWAPTFHGNHLLRNNGSGVFVDAGPCADPAAPMSPATDAEWDLPAASLAADVDDDGDVDLFLRTSEYGGSSRLWINDGSGSFTFGTDFPGAAVRHVADLDGDDVPDLVLNGALLQIARGLGGGAFGPLEDLSTETDWKDHVAVLDVDGDDDLDLVAVDKSSTQIVVQFNDGAGNFTPDVSLFNAYKTHTNAQFRRVMSTDVNDDGLDDLIVFPVRYAFNSSYIFQRVAGRELFDPPVIQTFEPTAAADVDGDGDLDLFAHHPELDTQVVVLDRAHQMPGAGMRRQYGWGSAGSGDVSPCLGIAGPLRVGETAELRFTGLPPGHVGLLAVSYAASDLPNVPWGGTTGYNWPWEFYFFFFSGAGEPGVPGGAELHLPFTVSQLMADIGPLYHQIYWDDPGHPFGISSSNGLLVDYD